MFDFSLLLNFPYTGVNCSLLGYLDWKFWFCIIKLIWQTASPFPGGHGAEGQEAKHY